MSIIRASVLTLLLVLPAGTTQSFAAPNDGRFRDSVEGYRQQLCSDLKLMLDVNEEEADKRAGTKAAAKYAKLADQAWADGEKQGCSWAT